MPRTVTALRGRSALPSATHERSLDPRAPKPTGADKSLARDPGTPARTRGTMLAARRVAARPSADPEGTPCASAPDLEPLVRRLGRLAPFVVISRNGRCRPS